VRVYPDPLAFGDPLLEIQEVHSRTSSVTNLPATPAAGSKFEATNADKATIDLQAYPVLTEEISPSGVGRIWGTAYTWNGSTRPDRRQSHPRSA